MSVDEGIYMVLIEADLSSASDCKTLSDEIAHFVEQHMLEMKVNFLVL